MNKSAFILNQKKKKHKKIVPEKRNNLDSEETTIDPKTLRMNYPEALTTKFETLKIINKANDKFTSTTNSVTVNPSASDASAAAINADAKISDVSSNQPNFSDPGSF